MTLRCKTLLISVLAMLLLAGGFYVVAALIQANGLAQIERSQMRGGVARVWQALAREADNLQSSVRDYANEDASLRVTAHNRQALEDKFNDKVMHNLRVNVVLLLNTNNEMVFSKPHAGSAPTPVADSSSLDAFAQAVSTRMRTTHDLRGYFRLADHLVMFAAQPIASHAGSGTSAGTLILGRNLNPQELQRLNQTSQMIVQMRHVDASLPEDFAAARRALSNLQENLLTVNISGEVSASYALVTDILGAPAAILRMDMARTSHELGMASTRYLLWALLAAGLALAAANVWIVDRLVLGRMSALGRDVDRIAQNREFETRLGTFGNDELAVLALRINELLAALHSQHELQQALAAAQDATHAKSLFLANMSHELRTPLNAIIGYSELLADDAVDRGTTAQLADLKRIVEAGHHLQHIVSDVLDLAKIEAGKLELNYAPFNLRHALELVRDVIQLRAHEKNLTLSFDVPTDAPDHFVGDALLLRQILLNLLNNAVKYTQHDGRVELLLNVRKLPGYAAAHTDHTYFEIQFAVRDTGIGIPANQLDALFKPFNRIDSLTNRRLGGTGLGLALSKQLCELMGGRMWVHSSENQGSMFFFTITVEAVEPQGAQVYKLA